MKAGQPRNLGEVSGGQDEKKWRKKVDAVKTTRKTARMAEHNHEIGMSAFERATQPLRAACDQAMRALVLLQADTARGKHLDNLGDTLGLKRRGWLLWKESDDEFGERCMAALAGVPVNVIRAPRKTTQSKADAALDKGQAVAIVDGKAYPIEAAP